jgi:hypothetical protein
MDNLKEGLGLGFELSGFIIASYFSYTIIAEKLGMNENITLAALMGLSLTLWTTHAFLIFNRKK